MTRSNSLNFNEKIMALMLLIGSCISISPTIPYLFEITGNVLSLWACTFFVVIAVIKHLESNATIKIDSGVIFFCLCVFGVGTLNAIYWNAFTVKALIYFFAAILVAACSRKSIVIKFIEMASRLHIWMLVFAFFGFLYAFYGGNPLFEILNEDGRANGFYLSTFSNTYELGFIRPSGFYDEPGALSFMVCLITSLRVLYRLDIKISWILMLLGFVTASVAHLIFFVFFVFFAIKLNKLKIINLLIIAIAIIVVVALMQFDDSPINSLLYRLGSRLETVDGFFPIDGRFLYFSNAFSYLNSAVIFFGRDGACILNLPECSSYEYGSYGENPLTLMVHWGLTLSWTYYVALIYLLIRARGDEKYILIGVLMLLLQRPNLLSYGYAVILVLYIYSLYQWKSLSVGDDIYD